MAANGDSITISADLLLGEGPVTGDVSLDAESVLIDGVIDTTGGTVDGTVSFGSNSVVQLTGLIDSGDSDVVLGGTSRLEGDGRIESQLVAEDEGVVSPGTPGSATASLSVGGLELSTGSVLEVQLNGVAAGSGYDQLVVQSGSAGGLV